MSPPVKIPIPGYTGGVSQLAPPDRPPTALQAQSNCWSALPDDIAKRHPLEHVMGLGLSHGGPVSSHFMYQSESERYLILGADRNLMVYDLVLARQFQVIPKGLIPGATGPTDFSYFRAQRTEENTITNSEDLASVNVTTTAGKNGLATSKTVGAAGSTLGPWGGAIQLRGLSADTTAGHWFAWVQAGAGGNVLLAGWNTVHYMVKRGGTGDNIGLAIYNDTGGAFLAAVTYQWSGTTLESTPTYHYGSATNPKIVVERSDVFGGYYHIILRYKATTEAGSTFSFGPYMSQWAGVAQFVPAFLRYDRGYKAQSYMIPPREAQRFVSLKNSVIALNRTVTPAMSTTTTPAKYFGELITIASTPTNTSQTQITVADLYDVTVGAGGAAPVNTGVQVVATLEDGTTITFEYGSGTDTATLKYVAPGTTYQDSATNLASAINAAFGVTGGGAFVRANTAGTIAHTHVPREIGGFIVTSLAEAADGAGEISIATSTTKNFEYRTAAPPADTDPTYYVDCSGGASTTVIAQRLSEKITKAFGSGVGHSFNNTASVTWAVGVTVTVASSGTTNATSASINYVACAPILQANYDDDFLLRIRQDPYDIRFATAVTTSLSAPPTGAAKCVNGTPTAVGSAAACAVTNGGNAVFVGAADRTSGITPSDVAGKLIENAAPGFLITADTNASGYSILGVAATTSIQAAKKTMLCREGGSILALSNADFSAISSSDSTGGTSMPFFTDAVRREQDLPTHAIHGMRIRVKRDPNTNLDDYYVKALTESGYGFGKVKENGWQEDVGYTTVTSINEATMPVVLTKTKNGGSVISLTGGAGTISANETYWLMDYGRYIDRLVGDEALNEDPSFIGNPIRAMTFWASRFGFFPEQNIVLSDDGSSTVVGFNFFLTSILFPANTDPIDVNNNVRGDRPSAIHSVLPFNDRLYIFTDAGVFDARAEGALSADTLRLKAVHDASISSKVQPVASQRSIFYGFEKGAYTGITEMFLSEEGTIQKPVIATAQVDHYLTGSPIQMAISPEHEILVVATEPESNAFYVHKWYDQTTTRLQLAWHKYEVSTNAYVKALGIIASDIYVVALRDVGWDVQRMSIGNGLFEEGGGWLCRLDRRVTENSVGYSKSYSAPNTTITIPWTIATADTVVVVNRSNSNVAQGANTIRPGDAFGSVTATPGGTSVIVQNVDLTGVNLWVGVSYPASFELTQPQLPADQGGFDLTRRLQTVDVLLRYEETGSFQVAVTSKTGGTKTMTFTAPDKASGAVASSTPPLDSGTKPFPVNSNADETRVVVQSSSHLPFRFSRGMWDCRLVTNG